jgi:uncharacterized protein (DUF58 family)
MRAAALLAGALAAIAACWVFANLQGGFLPWFLFYTVAALAVYEGLTAWLPLRRVTVARRLSGHRLSSGQPLTVQITVQRGVPWPLAWWRAADEVPAAWGGHATGAQQISLPLWGRTWTFTYRVAQLPRGVYTLPGVRLEAGDLLGLFSRTRVCSCHDEIIVYPQVVPVRGWMGRRPEERGLQQATRRRSEESSNVIGVRDYVPGDRLSRVHWPATARKGVLQAKEFELHVTGQLVFLPDLSRPSFQHADPSVFELEMVIAASLMKHAADARRPFTALFHRAGLTTLGPGADEALLFRCLFELALAKPDGGVHFPATLRRVAQEVPAGATLVVISPDLGREAAVAADLARRRVQMEWFVPLAGPALSHAQRDGLAALAAARVDLHLIRTPEQLSDLRAGGVEHVAPV